jgi:hypothetical protein
LITLAESGDYSACPENGNQKDSPKRFTTEATEFAEKKAFLSVTSVHSVVDFFFSVTRQIFAVQHRPPSAFCYSDEFGL